MGEIVGVVVGEEVIFASPRMNKSVTISKKKQELMSFVVFSKDVALIMRFAVMFLANEGIVILRCPSLMLASPTLIQFNSLLSIS